jgi:hypothetical protein
MAENPIMVEELSPLGQKNIKDLCQLQIRGLGY